VVCLPIHYAVDTENHSRGYRNWKLCWNIICYFSVCSGTWIDALVFKVVSKVSWAFKRKECFIAEFLRCGNCWWWIKNLNYFELISIIYLIPKQHQQFYIKFTVLKIKIINCVSKMQSPKIELLLLVYKLIKCQNRIVS